MLFFGAVPVTYYRTPLILALPKTFGIGDIFAFKLNYAYPLTLNKNPAVEPVG
jgi:hypothetical protein